MTCPGFTDLLYSVMDWDKNCRYKILGYQIEFEGKPLYVFDLTAYKIFREKQKNAEEGEEVQVEISADAKKEKITYRVPGVAYPADRAVQFDLTAAYEIHEGRVMEP